jgi:hypothetical protein
MGSELPGELISVLGVLGYTWPQADEEQLFGLANHWLGLADRLRAGVDQADAAAAAVWQHNAGEMVGAFRTAWTVGDGPSQQLRLSATGAEIIGAGLMICASVVLALKISVIVQLVALAIEIAEAVATAVVTFGASLLEIPVFRYVTKLLLDQLLAYAIGAVLNG